MVQSYKSGRAFRAGLGLSFSKYSDLTKLFYNIKSNDFFLSWRRFVVLTAVTSVGEVIVIFLQIILFANTAAFFYSLLGLVPHCFWEGDSGKEISVRRKDQSLTRFLACFKKPTTGFSYPQSYPRKFLLCL